MRALSLGLSVLAVLASSAALPALAQNAPAANLEATGLDADMAGIDAEIAAAEADLKNYDGGLLVALVQARIETLKLTRAILQNRIAAETGGAVTEITVPVGAPDAGRAAEIAAEIEAQNGIIAQAEAESAGAGGLVAALALSRVMTEKLNLASLRGALMEAKYGSILPVDAAPAPARPTAQASQAPAPAAAEGQAETAEVAAPEWADPDHPEIDYNAEVFKALSDEGFDLHGWWGVLETKAEIDDSPQVLAINASAYEENGFMADFPKLQAACREGQAALIYDTDNFIMGDYSSSTMRTTIRIDDETARTANWSKLASNKGSGLFGTPAQDFMRELLDKDKVFLRIDERETHDASFNLAGIGQVAEMIAAACGFSLLELTKEDYRAIQTMLNAAGFDAGTPDGVWGSGSANALRSWQEQNDLPPTGAPDEATLTAMGL
ncbi:peptidoglycan-binding domain-containing protein [Paracoccus sp. ME4]|uniref:peptidoglycan-binding domain-containing protein n=1 Tax=Paracoccus sp. ME4 TaxID=3138066 RepID=UPI00398AEE28